MEYLQSSLRPTGDAIVQDHITVLRFFLSKSVCMATEEDNAFIYACTHCHLQMAKIMIEESVAPIAIDAADSVSSLSVCSRDFFKIINDSLGGPH
jgi:hypothetical protein